MNAAVGWGAEEYLDSAFDRHASEFLAKLRQYLELFYSNRQAQNFIHVSRPFLYLPTYCGSWHDRSTTIDRCALVMLQATAPDAPLEGAKSS